MEIKCKTFSKGTTWKMVEKGTGKRKQRNKVTLKRKKGARRKRERTKKSRRRKTK